MSKRVRTSQPVKSRLSRTTTIIDSDNDSDSNSDAELRAVAGLDDPEEDEEGDEDESSVDYEEAEEFPTDDNEFEEDSAKNKKHHNQRKNKLVSITVKSPKIFTVKLNFNNRQKFTKATQNGKRKSANNDDITKVTRPKRESKGNTNIKNSFRTRKIKTSYVEPNEDDFVDDSMEEEEEEQEEEEQNDVSATENHKNKTKRQQGIEMEDGENEEDEEDEEEDEADEDEDEEEEMENDIDSSSVDLSKLSDRQKSNFDEDSVEPEDMKSDDYQNKSLPRSVMALMDGHSRKKQLTEEEIQLRKAEAARKRKTFNIRRLEAEKKETLKKLLHRKVEKVDAKKQEEENERRRLNQLKRKEIMKHKALFSWVSKTELIDDVKKNVSYYSMQ